MPELDAQRAVLPSCGEQPFGQPVGRQDLRRAGRQDLVRLGEVGRQVAGSGPGRAQSVTPLSLPVAAGAPARPPARKAETDGASASQNRQGSSVGPGDADPRAG